MELAVLKVAFAIVLVALITNASFGQEQSLPVEPEIWLAPESGGEPQRVGFGPPPAYERGAELTGDLVLPVEVSTRNLKIHARLTDSIGRVLLDREVSPSVTGGRGARFRFTLTPSNVVAILHQLSLTAGKYTARATIIFRPPVVWHDYAVINWHRPRRDNELDANWDLGVRGSQWHGQIPDPPYQLIEHNMRYYVEGTGNVFFAPYHLWMPDKKKNHYFRVAKNEYKKDRTDLLPWQRQPCLNDPSIQRLITKIFHNAARTNRDFRPYFYSIADEPGIGDQAAPSDFCFAPWCRKEFRAWLKKRYRSLAELNAQWDTTYESWDKVRALTTDETFARKGDNFSPWCDHKEFMDTTLITTGYGLAADAVRKTDKAARVGGGGFQGPTGVGGWDYWKICQVLDVIEAYYIGNNYELIRSFRPDMVMVNCSFGAGNPETHKVWYLAIHGDRGMIIWNERPRVLNDDLTPSARGKRLSSMWSEFNKGFITQRIYSERDDDPIAIYESQPSLRVHWCLDVRPQGKNWINRSSATERRGTTTYRMRESVIKVVEDNGLQFSMLCDEQVKAGELKPYDATTGKGYKVLIMPRVIALSNKEARAIRSYVKNGGTVIAAGRPGLFDEHGKRLSEGRLDDVFGKAAHKDVVLVRGAAGNEDMRLEMINYHRWRLHKGKERRIKEKIGKVLLNALGDARRAMTVVDKDDKPVTGVEVTTWKNGSARIVAVHRNPQMRISELGPQEYRSNKRFETPVELTLKAKGVVYDMRAGEFKGDAQSYTFTLNPWEPTILCVVPEKADPFTFKAKGTYRRGEAFVLELKPGANCALAKPVYHIEAVAPGGTKLALYDQNVVVTDKKNGITVAIPFALNDKRGTWKIVAREAATGQTQEVKVAVR